MGSGRHLLSLSRAALSFKYLHMYPGLSGVFHSLAGLVYWGSSALCCLSPLLRAVPMVPGKTNSADADMPLCLLSFWRDSYSSLELHLSVCNILKILLETVSSA